MHRTTPTLVCWNALHRACAKIGTVSRKVVVGGGGLYKVAKTEGRPRGAMVYCGNPGLPSGSLTTLWSPMRILEELRARLEGVMLYSVTFLSPALMVLFLMTGEKVCSSGLVALIRRNKPLMLGHGFNTYGVMHHTPMELVMPEGFAWAVERYSRPHLESCSAIRLLQQHIIEELVLGNLDLNGAESLGQYRALQRRYSGYEAAEKLTQLTHLTGDDEWALTLNFRPSGAALMRGLVQPQS